jgi:hypothetical protein
MTQQTVLMPIDPAVSPQQISRILPIRANLLPTEIMANRNSRRIRAGLIGTVIVVVVAMGGWFVSAVATKSEADANLATVTDQVRAAQARKLQHREITDLVTARDTISEQLATLLASDLPWATTQDKVRSTGTTAGLSVNAITGSLLTEKNAAAASGIVATLIITGTAPDKKTIANYTDALAKLTGFANPYLTTATQTEDGVSFTVTASLTKDAQCGRFTTPCKTGGK